MAMVDHVYHLKGRWDAAEELEVQVMETSKKKLGADHPDTLISMNNIAFIHQHNQSCFHLETARLFMLVSVSGWSAPGFLLARLHHLHLQLFRGIPPPLISGKSMSDWQGHNAKAIKLMADCV
jgi:hypothetical protein